MQVFMNTIIYISREKVMPYLSLQSEDIMTAEDIASIEKMLQSIRYSITYFQKIRFSISTAISNTTVVSTSYIATA